MLKNGSASRYPRNADAPKTHLIYRFYNFVRRLLVFNLAFLVLQMQNSPSLWMVEGRRPVAGAEEKRHENRARDGLKP